MPEQQEAFVLPAEVDEGRLPVVLAQDVSAQGSTEVDISIQNAEEEASDQDILDDLGEIEFLLDEIEDQIAPLAL